MPSSSASTPTEKRHEVDIAKAQAIDADLAVAERLSRQLGEQINQVAQLRQQQAARRDLDVVAATAAKVRAALERNDQERQRVLAAFSVAPDRIQRLAERERGVRDLAARCADKIAGPPRLAVPSVAALGGGPDPAKLAGLPWSAARAQIEPFVDKLDRVERALDEAARRFGAPLAERDDLRGLLEGFRGKAGANGFSEDPAVEPLYRQARDLLWSAPCDLDGARPLVQRYIAAVNARIAGGRCRPMKCTQPLCTGTIVDGYCDVCGMAPQRGARRGAAATARGQRQRRRVGAEWHRSTRAPRSPAAAGSAPCRSVRPGWSPARDRLAVSIAVGRRRGSVPASPGCRRCRWSTPARR